MSDTKDKPEETADTARGRGAPKKDPSLRLTHSIRLSFTKDQYLELIKRSAADGFTDVGAWIKSTINKEK